MNVKAYKIFLVEHITWCKGLITCCNEQNVEDHFIKTSKQAWVEMC